MIPMKRTAAAAMLLCAVSVAAAQQAPAPAAAKDRLATMVAEWERAKLGTQEYIEAMPEEHIGFKPTPEIRSFAEQYLHIANGNYMFGSRSSGAKNPQEGQNLEKMEELLKSKAALRQAVLASYDFVISAVKGMTEAQLDEEIEFFRMKMPRYLALTKGIEHHAHHRGQTTIYLRLKGITPPSERLF
jgi:uncharacterized damage-inducible protein DinB